MSQEVTAYRVGLVEAILLLGLLILAFGSITIAMRERWLKLGVTESLLARLAASVVVASVSVGGLGVVVVNLLQASTFSDANLSATTARNQALLGIGLALALTVVAIIRIETYHRNLLGPPVPKEDAEWKVEPRR